MSEDESCRDIPNLPMEELQGILPESSGQRLHARNQGKLKGDDCQSHVSTRDRELQASRPLSSRLPRDCADDQRQQNKKQVKAKPECCSNAVLHTRKFRQRLLVSRTGALFEPHAICTTGRPLLGGRSDSLFRRLLRLCSHLLGMPLNQLVSRVAVSWKDLG